MSLLARVDRLTASSLQPLCFIFGCLLCLSAVILRDGFERTCFHLFKIRRKRASFHVLSALYHKCEKKKKKRFKRELTRFLSTCFSAAKSRTGRSQTCSLVTWEDVEIRVKKQDLLVQGHLGPLSLNAHQNVYSRVWFYYVGVPSGIKISLFIVKFQRAKYYFLKSWNMSTSGITASK